MRMGKNSCKKERCKTDALGYKLSFSGVLLYAPTAGFSRLGNYRKCEYFKTVNLVVLEESLEILFAECWNNVLCPPTR